jgi:4-amino-4-deoxy-L-arabinose transferase-like glycosyltransferase
MSPGRGPWIIALVAGAFVWLTGITGAYGWFADELYFLACAKRLAFGYVDQPPLAPAALALLEAIGADALWLVRLVPAVTFAATVLVTARIARQLGGDATAQTIAAVLLATSPAFLVIASFYSMNPLELLLLALLASTTLELATGAPPRRWLRVGGLAALAALNKHTFVVPATLLVVATTLSPARAHLAGRWPYLGLALAVAVAAPHLAWLVDHDLVTFEFYRVSTAAKNVETTAAGALGGQLLFAGPLGFVVAVLGAGWLARGGAGPRVRGFAAVFVAAVALMTLARVSRPDRVAGVYPLAFAAGAVALARLTDRRRWLRRGAAVALALATMVTVPLVLPVLPPPQLARYAAALDLTPQLERQRPGAVPQWLADRLDWPAIAAQTAAVVGSLAPADRARVVLYGESYGVAGALERHGPAAGLRRPVVSPHNAYWTWGPRPAPVLVGVGGDLATLRAAYGELREVTRVRCNYCYLAGAPIWIARGPADALARAWPALRRFQ